MTLTRFDPDHIASSIAGMSRRDVKQEILKFDAGFKLDFSEEYLESLPLERLRHILLAARLQRQNSN